MDELPNYRIHLSNDGNMVDDDLIRLHTPRLLESRVALQDSILRTRCLGIQSALEVICIVSPSPSIKQKSPTSQID